MKNLRSFITAFIIVALGFPALAGGQSASRPLKNTEKLRVEIFNRVDDLRMTDFNREDASVELSFFITKEGDLVIESIDGDNPVVTNYVSDKLQSQKMYVSEELQDTRHSIKISYVVTSRA